eukprot:9504135-Pyramimonas_sp.AAC.2
MLQNNAGLWGLDRIDQQDLPYDNSFVPAGNGTGAHVYIIDTGINSNHNEYAGRIGDGYDFFDNDANPEDCEYLTHCSNVTLNRCWMCRALYFCGSLLLLRRLNANWCESAGGLAGPCADTPSCVWVNHPQATVTARTARAQPWAPPTAWRAQRPSMACACWAAQAEAPGHR